MPQRPALKQRDRSASGPVSAARPAAGNVLVIGDSLRFRGELEVTADLRIEGTIRGCINASLFDVTIEADGIADANIHAGNVTVRGKVYGAIVAEGTVHLLPSAEVHGPIHAARVVLDDGCLLTGRVDVSNGADSSRRTPSEPLISPRGGRRQAPPPPDLDY